MAADGAERVELADGNWIDLRTRQTLADMEALEVARLARGGEPSATMDFITIVGQLAVAWSYDDEVTPENVKRTISVDDVTALRDALAVKAPKAPSASSSAGTTRKRKSGATRRSSGG